MGIATLCRILLNTARRFVYPFAPALSRGMGVPLTSVTSLIAVIQVTGLLSPLFGPLGDRIGYRIMLLVGLGLLAGGMLTGGFFPFYGMMLVALVMAGLGKSVFDPAIQAYVGERVPYQRRGLVIGIMETAWAGSTLVGIPVIGILIESFSWRAPFFAIGILALCGMLAIVWVMPPARKDRNSFHQSERFRDIFLQLVRKRPAVGLLLFAFFVSVANDNFFVIYGAWLEESFNLSIVALGMITIVIGVAELLGEVLVALVSDRLGLRRSLVIGLVLSSVSYLAVSWWGGTVQEAMAAIFFVFLTLEFAIVTAISICTEVLPGARATMMASYLASASGGRVVGALMGGLVWEAGRIEATALVSTSISILALAAFFWSMQGWQPGK
ncbi:MAG: MFS transporter [Deltaproteobacteria bacterium]|nr:MFS transporter [Deltaproteobacteria bacterium]